MAEAKYYNQKKRISNEKYDSDHYDKVTVKLPKGLKAEILAKGYTVSGFLVEAAKEKLNK